MSIHIVNNKPMTNAYYPMRWAFSTDPFPAFRAVTHGKSYLLPFAKGMDFDFPDREECQRVYTQLYNKHFLGEGWRDRWDKEVPQGVRLRATGTTDTHRRYALLDYCFGKDGHRGRCPSGEATQEFVASDYTPCKLIRTKKGTDLIVPCPKEEDEHIMLFQGLGGFRGSVGGIGLIYTDIIKRGHSSKHCVPVWTGVARLKRPDSHLWFDTGRRCSTGTVVKMGFKPDGTIGTWSMTAEEHKVQQELEL